MITGLPTEAERLAKLTRYQANPILFQTECLDVRGEYVWPKMVEVAESVRDYEKTAVKAGHGVSKSYEAARLALWFLCCHYPSTVITTAPTHNQVEEILWREIRDSYSRRKIPLYVEPTKTKLDLGEKWFALGFSTRPDTITQEATRFHGYHNDHIMVIFDEAAGIAPEIWKAAQHLLTSGHTRWLAIGNPTADVGDFADCFNDRSGWNRITISVTDTPNFKAGREIIPGVSGRPYASEIERKYGADSNEYKIRVLGEIPAYTEGTFYGSRIAKMYQDGRISAYDVDETEQVYTFSDYGKQYTAIIWAQFIRNQIHMVDFYYDNEGLGVPGYVKLIKSKPYNYDDRWSHWGGPDLDPDSGSNRNSLGTGRLIIKEFDRLGLRMNIVQKHRVNDGIALVKNAFSRFRIDKTRCSELIDGIKKYRLRKNLKDSTEDKIVYFNDPVQDWTTHVADALRHLVIAYRFQLYKDGIVIGSTVPIPAFTGRVDKAVIWGRAPYRSRHSFKKRA